MATIGNTYLTLADLYKRKDPDDSIAAIIEVLAETNPILQDMMVVEANDGTTHLTTTRTGLPSATWRRLYEGVQPSKSTTKQVRDTVGMLEAWSEVDAKLVELSNDPAGLRLSEATAFLEAMNQEMATGLFYHNTKTDPERFLGLSPRFSDLSADNAGQIVPCGGSGSDNTSMWMMVWGQNTVHGLYPKGSMGGLRREDKGKETKEQSDGSMYDVFREKFCWDLGLSVRDWRYIVRLPNIDVSDLSVDASTGANLLQKMTSAYWRLWQRRVSGGRAAIYCNRTVLEYLDHQSREANSNTQLAWREYDAGPVLQFRGMPIRECDALLDTEATVS